MNSLKSLPTKFWQQVDINFSSGCWIWTGVHFDSGYARYRNKSLSSSERAHRVVYETLVGPIPNGLVLDHLCEIKDCVNPMHVEPVTDSENLHRSGITNNSINRAKTHCIKGHEFTRENTIIARNGTKRVCRTCQLAAMAAYRERKRAHR